MAENEDGQEKTEEPTAKRLQDARRKGQIARSRELNTMAITLAGGVALMVMSDRMGDGLSQLMHGAFNISRPDMFDSLAMVRRLASAMQDALLMLVPFMLLLAVVAIGSSVVLGGMAFSAESIAPKLSKLNPLKGLKRIFSAKGLVELLKALAKFFLIGGTTTLVIWHSLDDFLRLGQMELGPAMDEMGSMVGWSFVLIASTMILIALIDVPFQLWDHTRQLKMTRQEIRDEMKETEGRPEVKGRIRSLQREMAQRRMMEQVPEADVIVTNPTHYAVALRYDQERMQAPKLVAKGVDLMAVNIRRIAQEHQVLVVESPLLARAIYAHTRLDETIPAGLYLAVAKLLAYVFQLRVYQIEGGPRVPALGELDIPEELQVPAATEEA